MLLPTQRGNDR